MNIRRLVAAMAALLLCGLAFTYMLFETDDTPLRPQKEECRQVQVLACYEIRQERELLSRLAEEFNESREDCLVQLEFIDKENLKKDVSLRVDGGIQPDIVICDGMEMSGLADMGVLEDVTELVQEDYLYRLMYAGLWQSAMSNGSYYGIPFTGNPYVLFVNSDYLKKLGKAVPHTWNQVLEICSQSSQNGIYGLGMGVKRSGDGAGVFNCILHACGANYYSLYGGSGERALEIVDTLKRWGYVDKSCVSFTQKDAALSFAKGQCVMLMAPLDTRVWLDNEEPEASYIICGVPREIKGGYVMSGENLGFLKGAAPQAYDFVEYLYSGEVRWRLVEGTGTLPIFMEELTEYEEKGDLKELSSRFVSQGEVLKYYNSWFELSGILSDSLRSLLTVRNIDLPEAARELQDEVRKAIVSN